MTVEPPQVMLPGVMLLRNVSAGLGRLRPGPGGEDETMPDNVRGRLAVKVEVRAELERRNALLSGEVERLCVWSMSPR